MKLEISRVELLDSLHSVTPQQLELFRSSVSLENLDERPILMDLFTGSGIAAKTLEKHLVGTNNSPKGIILVDRHPAILNSIRGDYNTDTEILPVVTDLRIGKLPIESSAVDLTTAKMGFHELPLSRQEDLARDVYRTLKPNGQMVLWENDVVKQDDYDLYGFNEIIRTKDRLAGLDQMALQRYFTSSQELHEILTRAGFAEVTQTARWIRRWRSFPRLAAEFKGDITQLKELNRVIDDRIPTDLRDEINYRVTEDGFGREFDLPTIIIRARK